MKIDLPYPDSNLSPNSRSGWRAKHRATKEAKGIARLKTLAWLSTNGSSDPDASLLRYTFYPSSSRRRDDDNLIAMMKPYRDGIAAALGIDDSALYTCRPVIAPPDKANPRVTIELITL